MTPFGHQRSVWCFRHCAPLPAALPFSGLRDTGVPSSLSYPFCLGVLVCTPGVLLLPSSLKYCCSLKSVPPSSPFLLPHCAGLCPCCHHLITWALIPPVYSACQTPSPGDPMHASTCPNINPPSCPPHVPFVLLHALIQAFTGNRSRQ